MPNETSKIYESIARIEEQLKVMPSVIGNIVGASLSGHVKDYHKKNSLAPKTGFDKQLATSIAALISALAALIMWLIKS